MKRPSDPCIFFLAQKPYNPSGSLYDQVSFPKPNIKDLKEHHTARIAAGETTSQGERLKEKSDEEWDRIENWVIDELHEKEMAEVFTEANMPEVWDRNKTEAPNTKEWEKVLSGGQLQRLSIARALWHHRFYAFLQKEHVIHPKEGFFLVLDESTAALDVKSELHVYDTFRQKKIGFLSIGHRDTLLQFHDRVLEMTKHPEEMNVPDWGLTGANGDQGTVNKYENGKMEIEEVPSGQAMAEREQQNVTRFAQKYKTMNNYDSTNPQGAAAEDATLKL